jgi:hypothetical protein
MKRTLTAINEMFYTDSIRVAALLYTCMTCSMLKVYVNTVGSVYTQHTFCNIVQQRNKQPWPLSRDQDSRAP